MRPSVKESAGASLGRAQQDRGPVARQRGPAGVGLFIALILLLALPVYAGRRLAAGVDWRVLTGVAVAVSCAGFLMSWRDKRRAEAGAWRVPEAVLHGVELLGGWPGSFLAQRLFRHKISKVSYQLKFWAIVALYQYVAWESMQGWRWTHALLKQTS